MSMLLGAIAEAEGLGRGRPETPRWTEPGPGRSRRGSAQQGPRWPPQNEGLPASAACWKGRVFLASLTHSPRLSFGGPAHHHSPSAVSSGPGLKCLRPLKMECSFTEPPKLHSPVGLSLPSAQHRSHTIKVERCMVVSEPRLQSCVRVSRTGGGGTGTDGQERSEKLIGSTGWPAAPSSLAVCHQSPCAHRDLSIYLRQKYRGSSFYGNQLRPPTWIHEMCKRLTSLPFDLHLLGATCWHRP